VPEAPPEEESPVAVRVAVWTVEMVVWLRALETPALMEAETADSTLDTTDSTLDTALETALEMADSTGLVLEGVASAVVLAGKNLGR
jgi:hypothetical protein